MSGRLPDSVLRPVIAQNVDRDLVGSRLTPEARERAIDFGLKVWRGNMGNGEAADIGISHVSSSVLED